MTLNHNAKMLVIAGAWLFLLGLLQGVAVPMFANPRMGLSAHLTAVQSGTALMILGVIWSLAVWSETFEKLAFWTTLVGTYGLWLGLTLAAATGASDALPMAGQGYSASRLTELAVSALVMISGGLMIIGWLLFSVGVLRSRE
jgi:(hydroxyamino)benzene mutase